MHLDHITIRTRNLSGTRDFLLEVFEDLKEKPRPVRIQRRLPGHWLFADDKPIVHLIPSWGNGNNGSVEAFDHVGIKLEDYLRFRTKLEKLDIPYSMMDLPEINERRLFFHTPSGLLIEAVFNEPINRTEEKEILQ